MILGQRFLLWEDPWAAEEIGDSAAQKLGHIHNLTKEENSKASPGVFLCKFWPCKTGKTTSHKMSSVCDTARGTIQHADCSVSSYLVSWHSKSTAAIYTDECFVCVYFQHPTQLLECAATTGALGLHPLQLKRFLIDGAFSDYHL